MIGTKLTVAGTVPDFLIQKTFKVANPQGLNQFTGFPFNSNPPSKTERNQYSEPN
jgi:hypothetical protein